jgi:preprotein translocase subunit SecG
MVFGVRRTADFLTKSTQILAGVFLLLSLLINIAFLPRGGGGTESVIQGQGGTGTQQAAPVPQQLPPAQPPVGTPGN